MASLSSAFALGKHGAFFRELLRNLPKQYTSMDTNRPTLLYFALSGLDLLGMLEEVQRDVVVSFLLSLQSPLQDHGGFYGYPKVQIADEALDKCNNQPHIANTYAALASLAILGDDFSRVNREAIAHSLRKWQLPEGHFCCVHGVSSLDSESDMRFVYCATAICYMLDLWHAIDVDRAAHFILSSQSYDMAFGMGPQTESHGGCTYCALAALSMMGRLHELPGKEDLIGWCTKRQQGGFQGRVGKATDSCYAFWVGASLKLLGADVLINSDACTGFLTECECPFAGGFLKNPDLKLPDLLHTYFSVCGFSLCGLLPPLNPHLGISERASSSAVASTIRLAPGARVWVPQLRPGPSPLTPPPPPHSVARPAQAARPASARSAAEGPSPGGRLQCPASSRRVALLVLLVAVLVQVAILVTNRWHGRQAH